MKLIEQIDIQPQHTKWLFDLQNKGLIEVDNSFQRNYVWLEKHQIKLIETILIGSPIPEIYLWKTGTDSNTGDTKYSIVDGQQRTGAIFQFIHNGFKLKESSLDHKTELYSEIKNKFFRELDDKHKQSIWAYVFSIRIVRQSVPREKIVQMFLRLNTNNMTLNPQELRNAEFEGEFMELAAELADMEFWDKNKLFGIADRRRMRDITFVSGLLTFMKLGIDEELTSKNINKVYELFNDEYPNKEIDKSNFIKITSEIDRIIEDNPLRQTFLNTKVHLYTLFNFVYSVIINENALTEEQISNYRTFIDNYEEDSRLEEYFGEKFPLINEYKALSKEGTNKKPNRIRRFEIVSELLG